MAGERLPGPQGGAGRPMESVRDGTSVLVASPLPGVLGASPMAIAASDAIDRLRSAAHWADIEPWVVRMIGPQCFGIGVAHGIGLEIVGSFIDIGRLAKTFVLADLADVAFGKPAGSPLAYVPIMSPYDLARRALGAALAYAFEAELRAAQDERSAIVEGVGYAFTHPGEFFSGVTKDYVDRWEKFKDYSSRATLTGQYEAGKLFGGFLLEVLSLIATGAAIVKLAQQVPKLAGLMTRLKRAAASLKSRPTRAAAPPATRPTTPSAQRPAMSPKPEKRKFETTPLLDDYAGEHLPGNKVWDGNQVKYLSPAERKQHMLTMKDGKLYDADGRPFDTAGSKTWDGKPSRAIFVMDEEGTFYASKYQSVGEFHHSSLLSGRPVAAAGEMEVKNGVLTTLSDRSGHYQPPRAMTEQALESLRSGGIDTSKVRLERLGR